MRTLWNTSGRALAHRATSARLLVATIVVAAAATTAACSSGEISARERQMFAANGMQPMATGVQATGAYAPGMMPIANGAGAAIPGGVVVTCPAGTQALITPGSANGQAVSQVACVADGSMISYQPAGTMPVAYGGAYGAPVATPAVVRTVEPVRERVVYTQPRRTTRTAQTEVRQSGRTWKKSAVIIGSSAGVGAGVGAAVGGKKGALIGAAIGGGGAAIWDQATRK